MLPNIRALQHHEADRVSWVGIYKTVFVLGLLRKNREVSAFKIRMGFSYGAMQRAAQDVIHDHIYSDTSANEDNSFRNHIR